MTNYRLRSASFPLAALLLVLPFSAVNAFGQAQAVLTRAVPSTGAQSQAVGQLAADQIMNLDVVLRIRDQATLDILVRQVSDPASPSYRHFLTASDFTARFGPSQADYDALVQFLKSRGFTVVGGTRDSMDVAIKGPVSAVQTAFNVTMRTFQHPTENRTYYAPDREPTVNLPFQLWHVSGLSNYSIPRPALSKRSDYLKAHGITAEALPLATTGSGPSASFLGSDMRAAYYGNGSLTGAGQNLGLFEYAGTDLADLTTYFNGAHQTNKVPVTLLSTDGTSTACAASAGCDDTEQTLDMTQAISMAPGLSSLVMYVGSTDTAIFGAMTTHNPLPTTIGVSWVWSPVDPTTLDPYFERAVVQGQTILQAAGDWGNWSSTNNDWPADNAYVVSVGGTDLTTASAGGAWKSETVWAPTGGGISANNIPIPSWQQLPGVINSSNKGSTVYRNGPDISANSNFTFYVCADQTTCSANEYGGTSFAAPMWAGYFALVNQQLAATGGSTVGFINPTIYALGVSSSYGADFHDITSGTCGTYSAVPGYDLCTGWGSPNAGLINALAGAVSKMEALNTSPLWADSGQSYHACDVVNISDSPVAIIIDLVNSSGAVLVTTGASPLNLAVGNSVEIANFAQNYSGYARCRFAATNAPGTIRANLSVYHYTGAYYDTIAKDDAR
jgi:subtilase family serine protease